MRVYVLDFEMAVLLLLETLSKPIPHMAKDNEDEVRNVGGDKVVLRGLVLDRLDDGLSVGVAGDVLVANVGYRSELTMLPGKLSRLFGRRRGKEHGGGGVGGINIIGGR